jgi:squalene-hopene/tetraprenyl-beta-curcumene cyclase
MTKGEAGTALWPATLLKVLDMTRLLIEPMPSATNAILRGSWKTQAPAGPGSGRAAPGHSPENLRSAEAARPGPGPARKGVFQRALPPLRPLLCAALCGAAASVQSADFAPGLAGPAASQANLSLRNEVQRAVDRGLAWLATSQNSNGWWSTPEHPAMTAMALSCFNGEPTGRERSPASPTLKRGYAYLLSCVKPDGSICVTDLVTYNTSLSMMGLLSANRPEYDPILRRARQFLLGLQGDFGEKGKIDSPFDGGIGYGTKYDHSDMGNTVAALEALYYTKHLVADNPQAEARDLNWPAVIHFLQSCQNLPSYNKEPWASDDRANRGGFIYYPGHSMAGAETNAATGRVALRSYGSISYAGLLSYVYADLRRDDPRVEAVVDWLKRNYSLQENPGMGTDGLYYYFHTMTKALSVAGVKELTLADGKTVAWRQQLALKLIDLQQRDGSWANQSGRWWERDPALVTCYVVMAMEMIWRGL